MLNSTETTKFEVGDGATVHYYSDCKAFTVIEVSKSGKRIKIQNDKATLLNGVNSGEPDALIMTSGGFAGHTSGSQRYKYERDESRGILTASLRKDGNWRVTDHGKVSSGRYEFYNFNF